MSGEEFPDILDTAAWESTPMWPGLHNSDANVSYREMYKIIKTYMVDITPQGFVKVCHTFRVLGSTIVNNAGIPYEVRKYFPLIFQSNKLTLYFSSKVIDSPLL